MGKQGYRFLVFQQIQGDDMGNSMLEFYDLLALELKGGNRCGSDADCGHAQLPEEE